MRLPMSNDAVVKNKNDPSQELPCPSNIFPVATETATKNAVVMKFDSLISPPAPGKLQNCMPLFRR